MKSRASNRTLRTAGCVVAATMCLSVALAQYSTGFENPPFVSGGLNSQDGWTSGGAVSVRTAAQIEAELAASGLTPEEAIHSGDQALLVSGSGSGVTSRRVVTGLDTLSQVLLDVWVRPLTPRADVGGNECRQHVSWSRTAAMPRRVAPPASGLGTTTTAAARWPRTWITQRARQASGRTAVSRGMPTTGTTSRCW